MRHVVQQLASYGRNGDNQLMHVSRSELAGLRSLAQTAGRDITTNPHTGLPEAFSIGDLLRIAAPVVAGVIGGPYAGMATGAALGAATNKENPMMGAVAGGIGGYGGGNLGTTLASAGEGAATSGAASELATSGMAAPTDLAAANATTAANAAVPATTATTTAGSAASDYAPVSSTSSTMAPQDAMRAYEHTYQNNVTGGSGFMDAAHTQGQQGVSRWDNVQGGAKQLWDNPDQAGSYVTMDNAKNIAAPIYASAALNPALQKNDKPKGGDNGYRAKGEVWYDNRVPVYGLPHGIQRSRIVGGFAQGGLLSLGVPGTQRGATQSFQGPVLGGGQAPVQSSGLLAALRAPRPTMVPSVLRAPAPAAPMGGDVNSYLSQYAAAAGKIPGIVHIPQNTTLATPAADAQRAIEASFHPNGSVGNTGGSGPGGMGVAPDGSAMNAIGQSISNSISNAIGMGGNSGAVGPAADGNTGNAAEGQGNPGDNGDGPGGGGDGWAAGGILSVSASRRKRKMAGGLPAAGQYLRGPGDGMSDHIQAKVAGGPPVRVAANEYVVAADVVSHLGNGSSDAGARVLDQMGAKIRKARTGNPAQGKRINPNHFTP